jgi:hypothetical protein
MWYFNFMRATTFRSSNEADTLVVSYYPLSGNDKNTGPRYNEEAAITGFDIAGVTRTGSNTLKFSPWKRHKLSLKHFDESCAEDADSLNKLSRNYDRVIWRGQSTGSFPTLGVVKSGLVKATHLILEDGINTRLGKDKQPLGPVNSRLDWVRYGREEKAGMPRPPFQNWSAPEPVHVNPLIGVGKFAAEQYHWAPLWRSAYSRESTIEIAKSTPELPILAKFLGHTGTSTHVEVQQFREELSEIQRERQTNTTSAASIHADYDPDGWHGFIIYPQFGAANLEQVASMQSFVA